MHKNSICTWQFLVPSVLVITFIHLNRFLVPDTAWDSLSYHVFQGQRALHNSLAVFAKDEFFPASGGNYSGLFEALCAFFREILGYRLGTLGNTISYLLSLPIILLIFKNLVINFDDKNKYLKHLVFLNAALVSEALFELATYFIDNIQALFILIGVLFCIKAQKIFAAVDLRDKNQTAFKFLSVAAFSFGLALYGKLTAAAIAVPMGLLSIFSYYFFLRRDSSASNLKKPLVIILLFLLPQLLQSLYLWGTTGSPLFPVYNSLFKSPFYTFDNYVIGSSSIGGQNFIEKLFYFKFALERPGILSEITPLFADFKIFIYWFLALAVIMFDLKKRTLTPLLRYVLFAFLLSFYFWCFTTGAVRYAIFIEIIGGILIGALILEEKSFFKWKTISSITLLVLTVQNVRMLQFNLNYDYSWRPPLLHNYPVHRQQIKNLFAKEMKLPLTAQEIADVAVVVNCQIPSAGYSVVSPLKDKPLILIDSTGFNAGLVNSNKYLAEVIQRLQKPLNQELKFVSFLSSEKDLEKCENQLKKFGFNFESKFILSEFMGYEFYHPVLITGSLKSLQNLKL